MSALPTILRAENLTVHIVTEWLSNGHDGDQIIYPYGILLHHTADNIGLKSVWNESGPDIRSDVPQPRANLWLPRAGDYDVAVVSAGRAYHAGRNSSVAHNDIKNNRCSLQMQDAVVRGLVDDMNGNPYLIGIEVENLGTTQELTDKQLDVLPRVCAALCKEFGWNTGRIAHHRQVTSRKPDMGWRGDIWTMTNNILQGNDDMYWDEDKVNRVVRAADQVNTAIGQGQLSFSSTVKAVLGNLQSLINLVKSNDAGLASKVTDVNTAVVTLATAVNTQGWTDDQLQTVVNSLYELLQKSGLKADVDTNTLLDALKTRLET